MISIEYNQVMIDQYTAIGNVDSTRIEIISKKQRMTIVGEKLEITAMNRDEIAIRGNLKAVMFDE